MLKKKQKVELLHSRETICWLLETMTAKKEKISNAKMCQFLKHLMSTIAKIDTHKMNEQMITQYNQVLLDLLLNPKRLIETQIKFTFAFQKEVKKISFFVFFNLAQQTQKKNMKYACFVYKNR